MSGLCRDFRGEEGWFNAECDLPRGHEGDHIALVAWPQHDDECPPYVADTPMTQAIKRIWAEEILRHLNANRLFEELTRD